MARKTADTDFASPVRDGRFWVFASGERLPVVAGGADRPVFPDDLSTLSREELQALIDGAVAWSTEAAAGEQTDESFTAMRETHAGYQRATAELAGRPPETPPSPTFAELAAQMVPVAPPAVAAVVAPTEPPAAGGTSTAPAAGGLSQADLIAAIGASTAAAVTAALAAIPANSTELEVVTADGELQVPDLDSLSAPVRLQATAVPMLTPEATITASADIPGHADGGIIADWQALGQAAIARTDNIRGGNGDSGPNGEMPKTVIARLHANFPPERTLSGDNLSGDMAKIHAAGVGHAITAAGGRCVPAVPYYAQLVDAGAERPLLAALNTFMMERMAVTLLPPPSIDEFGPVARTVTDGATNSNTTVTSATAAFEAKDRGASISGGSIPVGAYIVAVGSATSVTISAAATTTATGVTLVITRRGIVGSITQAQDAAALDAAVGSAAFEAAFKHAFRVSCPTPATYDLEAIYWFLEFGNWTTKAFPEQIPAAVKLALAWYARTAESKLLTKMKALSTAYAPTVVPISAIRAYISDIEQGCEYLRSRHRLPDSVTLRLIHPRWLISALSADVRFGSGSVREYLTNARGVVRDALADMNVVASDYIDSAVGDNQYFAPGPGNLQLGKLAAAGTLNYPATAASFLFPEGSFVAGVSSSIDFGVWRDTWLNERNNYRMGFEGWETILPFGYEMLHFTHTLGYNGTAAGAAYGSETVGSPVAIPVAY